MKSLCPNLNMLTNKTYDINMVAELVNTTTSSANVPRSTEAEIGSLGEINMMTADPAAPFDPIESERKIKELIGDTVNKAFDALRNELKADVLQLTPSLTQSKQHRT